MMTSVALRPSESRSPTVKTAEETNPKCHEQIRGLRRVKDPGSKLTPYQRYLLSNKLPRKKNARKRVLHHLRLDTRATGESPELKELRIDKIALMVKTER